MDPWCDCISGSNSEDEEIFLSPVENKELSHSSSGLASSLELPFNTPSATLQATPPLYGVYSTDIDDIYFSSSELDKDPSDLSGLMALSEVAAAADAADAGRKRKRDEMEQEEKIRNVIPVPLYARDVSKISTDELSQPTYYERFTFTIVAKLKVILARFHNRTEGHYFRGPGTYKKFGKGAAHLWNKDEKESFIKAAMEMFEPALKHFPFDSKQITSEKYRARTNFIHQNLTDAIRVNEELYQAEKEAREDILRTRRGYF